MTLLSIEVCSFECLSTVPMQSWTLIRNNMYEAVAAGGAKVTGPAAPKGCKSELPGLWITGIGTQYPPYLSGTDQFEEYVRRFYDVENLG